MTAYVGLTETGVGMKKLLLGTAMSLAMVAGASAADLYTKAPPPPSWTGCFIGANIGGGWSNNDVASSTVSPLFFPGGVAIVSANGSGIVGGGQIGCDYQFA